jgi:hypothetical protein
LDGAYLQSGGRWTDVRIKTFARAIAQLPYVHPHRVPPPTFSSATGPWNGGVWLTIRRWRRAPARNRRGAAFRHGGASRIELSVPPVTPGVLADAGSRPRRVLLVAGNPAEATWSCQAGPRVRIRLPPAASLARTRLPRSGLRNTRHSRRLAGGAKEIRTLRPTLNASVPRGASPAWQIFSRLIQEVRFALDSPVEGTGFELPVPVRQAKLTRSCR